MKKFKCDLLILAGFVTDDSGADFSAVDLQTYREVNQHSLGTKSDLFISWIWNTSLRPLF